MPSRFRPSPLPQTRLAPQAPLPLLLMLLPPLIVPILTHAAVLLPLQGAKLAVVLVHPDGDIGTLLAPPVAVLTEPLPPVVDIGVKEPKPQEEPTLIVELVLFVI